MSGIDEQRAQLLQRARGLGGRTLAELAEAHGVPLPEDLRRHKGFVGQLIERALGIARSTAPGPDIPELGVEVKTLPVDRRGLPLESTFVCTIHLGRASEARWETSSLRHKLQCVLWIPVEAERALALASRRVGSAFLWSPSEAQWQQLEADWTELLGRLASSGPESVSGHAGHWLQVRPKAAHSRVRTRGRDSDMAPIRVPPRGFYLRARFTRELLAQAFARA